MWSKSNRIKINPSGVFTGSDRQDPLQLDPIKKSAAVTASLLPPSIKLDFSTTRQLFLKRFTLKRF